jgi:hypothetical protein
VGVFIGKSLRAVFTARHLAWRGSPSAPAITGGIGHESWLPITEEETVVNDISISPIWKVESQMDQEDGSASK